MSHDRLFSDRSDLYARARPRYPREVYQYLAGVVPRRERAWDCACGNGQVAIDLAEYFDRVEATDISQEQIAEAPTVPRVCFSVGAAESTAFEDGAFDLIGVGQALHWFDYDRYWPEVDRLLKPGGVFAAWGYIFMNSNKEQELESVFKWTLYPIIEPYWAPQNRLLWNHYQSVQLPYQPLVAPEFRLIVHWDLQELMAYVGTWSAVRRCIDEQGDGFYRDTCREVAKRWGPDRSRREIEMDFCFVATQKSL